MTKKIQQSRFKTAGHFTTKFEMVVEHGVTIDDIKQPGFYAHIGNFLKPYDTITVTSDDMSIYAEVLVLAAERTAATVTILRDYDLTKADVVKYQSDNFAASDFEIKWRGPAAKFSLVRKEDNSVIREGFASKEDAENSLKDYLKTQAA